MLTRFVLAWFDHRLKSVVSLLNLLWVAKSSKNDQIKEKCKGWKWHYERKDWLKKSRNSIFFSKILFLNTKMGVISREGLDF